MIATLIVAHPARIHWAEELAADTGGTIVLDTDGLGAGGNHRRALEVGIDTGADHLLVLEDDALPVPGLIGHVEQAIEHRPGGDGLIGLYVGRQRPLGARVAQATRQATTAGAAWLLADGLLWGVATIWPTHLARDYLTTTHDPTKWDMHVRAWCRRHGHTVAYTHPSLVDHRDHPSLIPHRPRQPGRTAHAVGTPAWNRQAIRV